MKNNSTQEPENLLVEKSQEENNKIKTKPSGYWKVKEHRLEAIKGLINRVDYINKHPGSYAVSLSIKGEMDEFFPNSIKQRTKTSITYEECVECVEKYKDKKEIKIKEPIIYKALLFRKWMDEFFPVDRKSINEIKYEECLEKLILCDNNKKILASKYSKYHKAASKNKWHERLSIDVGIKSRKYTNYWDYETTKKESLKYLTKNSFYENSRSAYDAARSNNWLNEFTEHMVSLGNLHKRCIYICLFKSTKTCYIGLTFNFEKRKEQHLRKGPISEYLKNNNEEFEFIKLTDYLESVESQKLEIEFIEEYRKNKWNVLNKDDGGGLGVV
jgi:predicted GIY-YIG superfamily endonuclease